MANKSRKIKFSVDNFNRAMRGAGFISVRDMCNEYYKDTILIRYYDKCKDDIVEETISRKTLDRALNNGEMSARSLRLFSILFGCTEEYLINKPQFSKDIPEKDYNERTHDGDLAEEEETILVFITTQLDPITVTGKRMYWMLEPDSTGINVYTIWSYKKGECDDEIKVAEFKSACVSAIIRVKI